MKLTPLKDFILLEPIEETTEPYKKVGTLWVPTQIENGQWAKGKVTSLGLRVKRNGNEIKEGVTVMFKKGAGHRIEHDDKVYIALKKHDLQLIEEES